MAAVAEDKEARTIGLRLEQPLDSRTYARERHARADDLDGVVARLAPPCESTTSSLWGTQFKRLGVEWFHTLRWERRGVEERLGSGAMVGVAGEFAPPLEDRVNCPASGQLVRAQ